MCDEGDVTPVAPCSNQRAANGVTWEADQVSASFSRQKWRKLRASTHYKGGHRALKFIQATNGGLIYPTPPRPGR